MKWNDHQREVRKEFRTFLRNNELAVGLNLSNIINAADSSLSAFIRLHLDTTFTDIYNCDLDFTLDQLAQYYTIIESHSEWLAEQDGYISLRCLEFFLDYECVTKGINISDLLKRANEDNDWSDADSSIKEGRGHDQTSIRYERSKKARERCLARWGYKCYICGMDFESVYGEIGKGFIEVHHKVPISQQGGQYELVPERDMVPLCSNCHSMVHYKTVTLRDVDVIKKLFSKKWTSM